ncbi:MAG: N-acyl homoserine lactonase family protein [Hyphomicrobiaceae bacterium]
MTQRDDGPVYEIYAIRYATNTSRTRANNFILDARPTEPLTLDYFSWLIKGNGQMFVIDTGVDRAKGEARNTKTLIGPVDALRLLGVDPETTETVVMTHLHYDHTGNTDAFPRAKFLLQAEEMAYVTGPFMEHAWCRHAYDIDDICRFIGYLHTGRLNLHGKDHQIADGISVHLAGGHCPGQEVVRVRTERGWVVLASDALHYYEEFERGIPFAVASNIADMIASHGRIRELADSDDHVVPGHDPRIMDIYPKAEADPAGNIVRVDLAPHT